MYLSGGEDLRDRTHVIYCADVYTMYCLMAVVTIVVCHLCMQTFVLKGDAPHSHWKEQKEQASTL